MPVPPFAETLSAVLLALVPPSAATVPTVSPMPMALVVFDADRPPLACRRQAHGAYVWRELGVN